MSLDTVYRTLRLFQEHGMLTRVGALHDQAHFDARPDRHQHFVCSACGRIVDVYADQSESMKMPAQIEDIGSVEQVYIEWRGLCRACRG